MKRIVLMMMTSLLIILATACKKEEPVQPAPVAEIVRNLKVVIYDPHIFNATLYMQLNVWTERNGAEVSTLINESFWRDQEVINLKISNPPVKVYYTIITNGTIGGHPCVGGASFYVDDVLISSSESDGTSFFYVE